MLHSCVCSANDFIPFSFFLSFLLSFYSVPLGRPRSCGSWWERWSSRFERLPWRERSPRSRRMYISPSSTTSSFFASSSSSSLIPLSPQRLPHFAQPVTLGSHKASEDGPQQTISALQQVLAQCRLSIRKTLPTSEVMCPCVSAAQPTHTN